MVVRGTYRSPWKAISSLYGKFYQILSFKVGNGNKVRFWEDIWLGKNSLEVLFPSLFRLSILKSRSILEFFDQSSLPFGVSTSWNFYFSCNLLDREIFLLQELLESLERKRLCTGVQDRRDWLANSSGIFSCKSAFASLRSDNSLLVNYPTKCIWKLEYSNQG